MKKTVVVGWRGGEITLAVNLTAENRDAEMSIIMRMNFDHVSLHDIHVVCGDDKIEYIGHAEPGRTYFTIGWGWPEKDDCVMWKCGGGTILDAMEAAEEFREKFEDWKTPLYCVGVGVI